MKLITFAIPSYNSQDYMRNCIESLLPGGEDIEIIIVNDGSKDDTAKIADEYAAKYPDIIKAVHQENGGHGEAVNAGLANASGIYYKVVDSDDWLDADALPKVIATLSTLREEDQQVDMFLTNFIYDKVGQKHKKVMRYANIFPQNRTFGWDEAKHTHMGQYILMHSVIYRTAMLKECGLKLPKHTFYVDNIFVYHPLPYVKKMYYMDLTLYHYFIGRSDQSVNETVMIKRLEQQLKVNKIMIDDAVISDPSLAHERCREYMFNYLEIIMSVSSILCIRSKQGEYLKKKTALWKYLSTKDADTHRKMRRRPLGRTMNLPGKGGRKLSEGLYLIANKFVGFN